VAANRVPSGLTASPVSCPCSRRASGSGRSDTARPSREIRSTLNRSQPDRGRLVSTNSRPLAAAATQRNSLLVPGGRTTRRTRPEAMLTTSALSSSSTANG
jgi:hypothetical protein